MKLLFRQFTVKYLAAILIVAISVGGGAKLLLKQSYAAPTCSVSPILVNSCRPWLGGRASAYPLSSGTTDTPKNQLLAQESRIGRPVDIAHTYHSAGQVLNSDDRFFINRANTMLFADWKPATNWSAGSDPTNATTNSNIDAMADSVKSVAPKKLFITVWHEPQNDVTAGTYPCTAASGSAGTTAQYRAMWQNVRHRFDAKGVSNVVWAVDYQSYKPLECTINDLYPGDNLVDWVVFNAYGNSGKPDYSTNVQQAYDFYTSNSTANHNYTSKPWGIIEWNIQGTGLADATASAGAAYYKAAQTALDNNSFPRIKMNVIFDGIGPDRKDYRVAYDDKGGLSDVKQAAYTAFAQDPRFSDTFYASPATPVDTTPPAITLTSPVNQASVAGTIKVSAAASDNVAVSSVALLVDGQTKTISLSSPYNFSLDTTTLINGQHTLSLRAVDQAGNSAPSSNITITVNNVLSSGVNNIAASNIIGQSTSLGAVVATKIDGKTVANTTVDTTKLTNGTHTLTVNENGEAKLVKIYVHNPWRTALINYLRVHALAGSTIGSAILLVATALVIHFRRRFHHF